MKCVEICEKVLNAVDWFVAKPSQVVAYFAFSLDMMNVLRVSILLPGFYLCLWDWISLLPLDILLAMSLLSTWLERSSVVICFMQTLASITTCEFWPLHDPCLRVGGGPVAVVRALYIAPQLDARQGMTARAVPRWIRNKLVKTWDPNIVACSYSFCSFPVVTEDWYSPVFVALLPFGKVADPDTTIG